MSRVAWSLGRFHPAFAAEFGDAFLGGTHLENPSLAQSLALLGLALPRMLDPTGDAGTLLTERMRSALSALTTQLEAAKETANDLEWALRNSGPYSWACNGDPFLPVRASPLQMQPKACVLIDVRVAMAFGCAFMHARARVAFLWSVDRECARVCSLRVARRSTCSAISTASSRALDCSCLARWEPRRH